MLRRRILAFLDRFIEKQNAKLGVSRDAGRLGAEADREATISAVVTRADGSVENLGVISKNAEVTNRGSKELSEDHS